MHDDRMYEAIARAQNRYQRELEEAIERATLAPDSILNLQVFGSGITDLADGSRQLIIARPTGQQIRAQMKRVNYERLGHELLAPHEYGDGGNGSGGSSLEIPGS
jgi:hypothetical protein